MWHRLLLRRLPDGERLCIRLPGGRLLCLGGADEASAPLIVAVRTTRALAKIALNPLLAVGDAYMDGTLVVERGNLDDLMALATRTILKARRRKRRRGFAHSRGRANPRARAKRNVAHHYDLSGEFYRLFLDADQQYSCAYFERPDMTLEEAQAAKKRLIAAKLLLFRGARVLDIGSGWGGLALELARTHGAEVLGVTLSEEQLAVSRARAGAAGLGRVRFELRDYRDVTERFDRIVSVGMFEHVGAASHQRFFDTVAERLAEDGVALIHTIVRTDGGGPNNPWIEKHIFPGGSLPAISQIVAAVERAGLVLTDLEVLRLHYAETLRHWRERFAASRVRVRALYGERFCRMWEFYLAGAEAGFRLGTLAVAQVQLAKRNDVAPITRDYLLGASASQPPPTKCTISIRSP